MKVRLSYEKVITFSEEFDIDEHEYLHLKDLEETRPHSFLQEVKSRIHDLDAGDNYDTAPEMEVLK